MNTIKFHKAPHRCLGNSKHKYSLGRAWIKSSLKEKDLGIDKKLSLTWQRVLTVQKAKSILGCSKSSMVSKGREEVLPLCSAPVSPTWRAASSSEAHNIRTWLCWGKSSGGPRRLSEGWRTSPFKLCWENWDCSTWKRLQEDVISAFQYLKWRKTGEQALTRAYNDKIRGNGLILKAQF